MDIEHIAAAAPVNYYKLTCEAFTRAAELIQTEPRAHVDVDMVYKEVVLPLASDFKLEEHHAIGLVDAVLDKIHRATWKIDYVEGRGKVRTEAIAPDIAIQCIRDAVVLLREPFSPRGMVAYHNRHKDFIQSVVQFAGELQCHQHEHDDFHTRLGKQIATIVLEEPTIKVRDLNPRSLYEHLARAAGEQLVYFVGPHGDGPIKIGIAVNPKHRLASLQTGNPHKLHILAITTGGRDQEVKYHEMFAEHRLQGEWFERHPTLLDEIERLI